MVVDVLSDEFALGNFSVDSLQIIHHPNRQDQTMR